MVARSDSTAEKETEIGEQAMKGKEKVEICFPLMELPDELWSRICCLAAIRISTLHGHLDMRTFKDRISQPPISRVCKVIRAEILKVGGVNTFKYKDLTLGRSEKDRYPNALLDWLGAVTTGPCGKVPDLVIESWTDDAFQYFDGKFRQLGLAVQPVDLASAVTGTAGRALRSFKLVRVVGVPRRRRKPKAYKRLEY
ncbi:hypothetical protein LTS10_010060 [Elasticomyces elasticus]|nr:hypothetical protein LTS10_010060 [Elasticomyces elasticus]